VTAVEDAVIRELSVLRAVETRVLWLATSIIQHANTGRPGRPELKIGGHQASSASAVSIMTALYFRHLQASDRVSVKPHASPVLHAIEYLLGLLDRDYLTQLRSFGGLQSYPSRVKDPVPADFSTGSVGIGATSPIWSALSHRYVSGHFDVPRGGRHISVLGDAELDEGAVWEALIDPLVSQLGEVLWIVDVNRQSLDRVVPDIAVGRLAKMFDAAGWHTITVKYGSRLQEIFSRPGGAALRSRIDAMTNEEYQHLLRTPAQSLRQNMLALDAGGELRKIVGELDDEELAAAVRDLGGHDLGMLLDAFAETDAATDRPSVIFAYTIKAWRLPTEGHPENHSALLSGEQWKQLGPVLGADPHDPWAPFDEHSPELELCVQAAARLRRQEIPVRALPPVPTAVGRDHTGKVSTQQAFGRFLLDLAREAPEVAKRVVTVSPDVASSTNLGGWINRVGVWNAGARINWFADDDEMLVRWREGEYGQHIELGIAEVNLVSLLGELGSTWSRDGEALLPIGTLYDPFVTRALEPWSFGIYAGGQSILVGTPSGVTLAPEGGAHQSIITPSIGIEQPGCIAWEPAFAQDLEWTFLHALSLLGRSGGQSSYFRLTTRPLDQRLNDLSAGEQEREHRRQQVLAGGYPLRRCEGRPAVTIAAVGAVVPEALAAADDLAANAVGVDVVCLTSPDLVFRAMRARAGLARGSSTVLDDLFPPERAAPLVTVLDGHPHTLAFLAGVRNTPITTLGVDGFGQSGEISDLYSFFGIDADTIAGAAVDLIE
jgi:pyruvate dehydrogenase E1 component